MSVAPAALDKATLGLHPLDQYEPLIGAATAERIFKKADRVRGAHVIHVNSTFYGGGVTEILTPLTLMMNAIGIETGWRQIQGTPAFFNCTKKLHNTLQGEKVELTEAEKAVYEQVVFENATRLHLAGCDAVVVHDPQPLPLVEHFGERKMPWLWQCHIDLSMPHPAVWNYLHGFVDQYDAAIFSLPEYAQDIDIVQLFFTPAINPFSAKNAELSESEIDECLMRLIDTDGDWWISETPVSGMEWIYDDLYEPAVEAMAAGEEPEVGLVEAAMSDNTYLPQGAINRLLSMFTEEERLMREKGQYTTVTGQLFKAYRDRPASEEGHVIPMWHPKMEGPNWAQDWRVYLTGDHGFNAPTAWLWIACDRYGNLRIFHEHYQSQWTVQEHAEEIHRYNNEMGYEPYLVCGDPAMNQKSGLTGDSIVAEYSRWGIEVQTRGITRDKAAGINKMNQRLRLNPKTNMPFMVITEDCTNTRREVKGAKAARIVNKLVAARKNQPEGIREKDDHTPDAIRYLMTLLPDLTYGDFTGQPEVKWTEVAGMLGGVSEMYDGIARSKRRASHDGWRDPSAEWMGME